MGGANARKHAEQDKQEEKAKKMQDKLEEKHRKDEERAAKAEEKRLAKEEKRRSKLGPIVVAGAAPIPAPSASQRGGDGEIDTARDVDARGGATSSATAVPSAELPIFETHIYATGSSQHKGEGSPTSPTAKVKGWIKQTFSREQNNKRRSFFGGASMKNKENRETNINNGSAVSIGNRSSSMHDVALAGKPGDEEALGKDKVNPENTLQPGDKSAPQHERDLDSQGVSPVSTPLEEERQLGDQDQATDADTPETKKSETRLSRNANIEPPRWIENPAARTSSPNRDSRFREELK